jgi:hypothetical protein
MDKVTLKVLDLVDRIILSQSQYEATGDKKFLRNTNTLKKVYNEWKNLLPECFPKSTLQLQMVSVE